jgi:hypothetical protein
LATSQASASNDLRLSEGVPFSTDIAGDSTSQFKERGSEGCARHCDDDVIALNTNTKVARLHGSASEPQEQHRSKAARRGIGRNGKKNHLGHCASNSSWASANVEARRSQL